MSVDIEKLEELTKAITPLPWRLTDKSYFYVTDENPNRKIAKIGMVPKAYTENASYIVAACNAVPELIKMYREADDEAADANSAWQKVRRENLALRERVRELEKALIELVKIEVPLPECAVCWDRDECTDHAHGDDCLAIRHIIDVAKEAAKEAGK